MGLSSRRRDEWALAQSAAIGNPNVARIEREITRLTALAGVGWKDNWTHASALRLLRSVNESPLEAAFETKDKGTWRKPQSVHFVTRRAVYLELDPYGPGEALFWFRDVNGILLRGSELRVVTMDGTTTHVFDFDRLPASREAPERHQRALDEALRVHDLFAQYTSPAEP